MKYTFSEGQMNATGILAAWILISASTSVQGAVPCPPAQFTSGFLPSASGGSGSRIPIICGLPASQNPVIGISAGDNRLRNEQIRAWSRSLGAPSPDKRRAKDLVDVRVVPVED